MQKEREAFESWFKDHIDDNTEFDRYSNEVDSPYFDGFVNATWMAWQAKAQAVPEGYQLVKKELNAELMYAVAGTDDINEHLWIEQIYKGLLKAQEPAND